MLRREFSDNTVNNLRVFLLGFDDLFSVVSAACSANTVSKIVLSALGALVHRRKIELPYVRTSLISASFGYLSLRYCHGLHLLKNCGDISTRSDCPSEILPDKQYYTLYFFIFQVVELKFLILDQFLFRDSRIFLLFSAFRTWDRGRDSPRRTEALRGRTVEAPRISPRQCLSCPLLR